MHHEKTGLQHPEDMQGTGHAVFHRARLMLVRMQEQIEGQVQQGAAWQEKQAAQIIPQDGSVVAQEQAKKVRVRVRLLAAQLGVGDDPAEVWNGLPLQGTHAAKDAQKDRVLLPKGKAGSAQVSLQKRTRRVQGCAAGRRAKELVTEGYDVFVEDEAAVGMSQEPGYGWRPNSEIQTGFSKKGVSLLGIMGTDTLYVRMADLQTPRRSRGSSGTCARSTRNSTWSWTTRRTTSRTRSGNTWPAQAGTWRWNFSRPARRSLTKLKTSGGTSRSALPAGTSNPQRN